MKSIVLALFVLFSASASAVQASHRTVLVEVSVTPTRVRACFGPVRVSCCRPVVVVKACCRPVVKACFRPVELVKACCRPLLGCRKIRVEDPDHVAPCSVPTKIVVCDPYTCKDVQLTVCMPKGCCVEPCVTRKGRKVQYSFGDHEVEIHFSRKEIVVDYDD